MKLAHREGGGRAGDEEWGGVRGVVEDDVTGLVTYGEEKGGVGEVKQGQGGGDGKRRWEGGERNWASGGRVEKGDVAVVVSEEGDGGGIVGDGNGMNGGHPRVLKLGGRSWRG